MKKYLKKYHENEDGTGGFTCKYVAHLEAEVKRLETIVAKLPVNGDGEPIVPGDRCWVNDGPVEVEIESCYSNSESVLVCQLREDGDECWEAVSEDLFSSKESACQAAEKARESE